MLLCREQPGADIDLGRHRARHDAIDANLLRPEFGGQHLGQRFEGPLGGSVCGGPGEGAPRVHRTDEGNGALALLEVRHRQSREQHAGDHVHMKHVDQRLLVEAGNRPMQHVAGIADQRVEAAAMFHRSFDDAPSIGVLGHVRGLSAAIRTEFARNRLDLVLAPPADRDPRAALRIEARDASADARTAAGDQHRHFFNRTHHVFATSWSLRPRAQSAARVISF